MLKKFFHVVSVKKGNFNKPLAMGFLEPDLKIHQAAAFTDSGCSAA